MTWFPILNFCLFVTNIRMECAGTEGLVCCDGYIWDHFLQTCKKCTPGFVGIACSIPCPYPLFGSNCMHTCLCPPEICNVSNGCTVPNRPTETVFAHTHSPGQTTIELATEDKHNTGHTRLHWQHTKLSSTTERGSTVQGVTNSHVFWGLFISNGALFLLVAVYISIRLKRNCARSVPQNRCVTDADLNIASPTQNIESNYEISEESGGSPENQIYQEINKSSSDESFSFHVQNTETVTYEDSQIHELEIYTDEVKSQEKKYNLQQECEDLQPKSSNVNQLEFNESTDLYLTVVNVI